MLLVLVDLGAGELAEVVTFLVVGDVFASVAVDAFVDVNNCPAWGAGSFCLENNVSGNDRESCRQPSPDATR